MIDITVVTPTIDGREDALLECISSVENQTIPPAEHIIKIDSLRSGPSNIRNEIAREAKTEWLLFLDDDDVLYQDYLEHVSQFMTEQNDVIYTWCHKNFDYPTNVEFDPEELKSRNFIPVTAVVRKSRFLSVGGFPSGPYEDWKLWLRLLEDGASFYCTKEEKWSYRRSDDGQWSKDSRR
jgi:glycosyltransferase involved in cell wall biosynthesis